MHGVIVANFCLLALICFLPFTTYALELLGITPPTPWNFVGLLAYPTGTIVAIFIPILGIIVIALVGLFYALPANIEYLRRPLQD